MHILVHVLLQSTTCPSSFFAFVVMPTALIQPHAISQVGRGVIQNAMLRINGCARGSQVDNTVCRQTALFLFFSVLSDLKVVAMPVYLSPISPLTFFSLSMCSTSSPSPHSVFSIPYPFHLRCIAISALTHNRKSKNSQHFSQACPLFLCIWTT